MGGDERRDGELRVMDGAARRQGMARLRRQLDSEGRRDGDSMTMDDEEPRERDGDGDGDVDVDTTGRDRDARDDVMVTRRRLTTRNHASAMAMSMLTRPAMGAIKANAALNYKN